MGLAIGYVTGVVFPSAVTSKVNCGRLDMSMGGI